MGITWDNYIINSIFDSTTIDNGHWKKTITLNKRRV